MPMNNCAKPKFQLRNLRKPRQMLVERIKVVAKPRSGPTGFRWIGKELPAEEI